MRREEGEERGEERRRRKRWGKEEEEEEEQEEEREEGMDREEEGRVAVSCSDSVDGPKGAAKRRDRGWRLQG